MEYIIGDIIDGTIANIKPYGIFIKTNDFNTFCHISNLSNKFIKDINKEYHIGQDIKAKIIKIDNDKVEVSIKVLMNEQKSLSDKPKSFQRNNEYNPNINYKESKNKSFDELLNNYLKSSKEHLDDIASRAQRKNKR